MAAGFDELIDFLLSEIALCGVQGAGSADFYRFIKTFYERPCIDDAATSDHGGHSVTTSGSLGRTFYERVWNWVSNHSDIRISYKNEVRQYSLSEFEAAELFESGTTGTDSGQKTDEVMDAFPVGTLRSSQSLLDMRGALQERLVKERHSLKAPHNTSSHASSLKPTRQSSRAPPRAVEAVLPIFDEPDATITTPRLFASQNRIWQALTGHGIDLKKVPSMEFVLLSLIAARGVNGITQPDLTQLSGQDKRSVPHRTNELARKGYIVKNPVQAGKIRTSLCVHTKFISQGHFLSSGAVEDVFQEGTFVLSGFVHLLYSKLKDAGIVPTRDIRKKLGVPMRTWNKRATQGALIRLDQTGMIKRFRVRKKHSEDSWATCIQVLREPRDEDVNNLGFRRQAIATDETAGEPVDELLDEDVDGDTLMRDLEVDMIESANNDNGYTDASSCAVNRVANYGRIPPQWTPDRFLANLVFDVVALGGVNGWDAGMLRDRIVGPFWRRPMESYVTRLTDDWEKTQPLPLRHLAIIRDSRNTLEKKFIHYVYRTYENFQKAVEAGEVHWEGIGKTPLKETTSEKHSQSKKRTTMDLTLDAWGFQTLNLKELVQGNGAATLSEVRLAIVHPRKYGPRWDNALTQEIGYQKSETPVTKTKVQRSSGRLTSEEQDNGGQSPLQARGLSMSKSRTKAPNISLTPEQRTSLGLKPNGRLSKSAEKQIFAHREKTGDPTSLPDKIEEEQSPRGQVPLMTAEERIAQGLPAKGRLGIARENQIREERGLAKLPKKTKPREKKTIKEPALLTKEQRLAFGWKGHGRLPQDLMDGLRQERENGIPLEKSTILPKYMQVLKAKAGTTAAPESPYPNENQETDTEDHTSLVVGQEDQRNISEPHRNEFEALSRSTGTEKRFANNEDFPLHSAKRQRTGKITSQNKSKEAEALLELPLRGDTAASEATLNGSSNGTSAPILDDTIHPRLSSAKVKDKTRDENLDTPASSTSTNMEAQHSLTPLFASVILQPDTSKLDPQAQVTYDHYINRSVSGLYVNPFAKHKVPRGRPRKALIATFKSSRLREYEWFKPNTCQPPRVTQIIASEGPEKIQETIEQPDESCLGRQVSVNDHPLLPLHALPPAVGKGSIGGQTTQQIKSGGANQAYDITTTNVLEEEQQAQHDLQAKMTYNDNTNAITETENGVDDGHLSRMNNIASTNRHMSIATTEISLQHPLPRAANWTAINTTAQSEITPYQSPYAPSIVSQSSPPHQVTENVTDTDTPVGTPFSPQAQPGELGRDHSLPEGVYGAISEIQAPAPPKQKPRGKRDHGLEGSGLLFRRQIIREIIDLCRGVFPDGGEIGRPFHTLWMQRHGHKENVKEPIASTVNATLRNMCNDPRFGLKRMVFLVKNKNGPLTSERAMITYAHLTPRSPEVLHLAFKIANFSLEKSHQYFPEEIRHLVDDKSLYSPMPVAPKDESVVLNQLNPELEANIKAAQRRRRNELARLKRLEDKARRAQNALVEEGLSKKASTFDGVPHTKRARLASLNDKNKRYRRAPLQNDAVDVVQEDNEEHEDSHQPVPEKNEYSANTSLIWTRPWIAPIARRKLVNDNQYSSSEAEETGDELLEHPDHETQQDSRNTQSTNVEHDHTQHDIHNSISSSEHPADATKSFQKSKKRANISDSKNHLSQKRPRLINGDVTPTQDMDNTEGTASESNEISSHETQAETDQNLDRTKLIRGTKERRFQKIRNGKPNTLPTLLERLTGLTGDPNDPIYQPPQRKQRGSGSQTWNERKNVKANRKRKEQKYLEVLDTVDKFKKLCCTLVIASSMSGEDRAVDWNIVENVYRSDKFFNLARTKKLWLWMGTHMTAQLNELTTAFQSSFIEAYQSGKVAPIEDPGLYDWSSLVQWAVRTCRYPELLLPRHREALQMLKVDESSYECLDRVRWYRGRIADRMRTQMQLHYTFASPLHQAGRQDGLQNDQVVKARSWVRANTSTPQGLYDGKQAHDKLMVLDVPVLTSVVGDYVEKQSLRMRKLKRLLPGRNYSFTKAFAKRFVRPFELSDFIAAVKVKKDMDSAFTNQDPQDRFFSISRSEEDGAVMAILSLACEGKVRLLPRLPPVNNEFGAPLPRLSVWGFCEGDYIHRAIDRNRLFWDIHVVPTSAYSFGNPLKPPSSPPAIGEVQRPLEWGPLPEPPLPGKTDPAAWLPIWSSIDGQSVTWPWWYRILNLVLQPLIFQPGATLEDIYAHCQEHTAEIFEIKLVLGWLETVNGVSKVTGGGYTILPSFWAVFGDRLLGTEDDWFGEHVKRKSKSHEKQQWRDQYNLRHSSLQAQSVQTAETDHVEEGVHMPSRNQIGFEKTSTQQILDNPKRQYSIMQQKLSEPVTQSGSGGAEAASKIPPIDVQEMEEQAPDSTHHKVIENSPELIHTPYESDENVEYTNGGSGVDDRDAEGEIDDSVF